MIKSSPKELKICRHDHKDLVNMSTKVIDESHHEMGGIADISSKNGVFSKNKNVKSRELVNPSDLALIKAVWIHHKELGKPPKSRAPKLVKQKTKVITREENDPLNLTQDRNPGGTRRIGPHFPIKFNTRSQ